MENLFKNYQQGDSDYAGAYVREDRTRCLKINGEIIETMDGRRIVNCGQDIFTTEDKRIFVKIMLEDNPKWIMAEVIKAAEQSQKSSDYF